MISGRWMVLLGWLAFIPLVRYASQGGVLAQILALAFGLGLIGYGLLAILNRWRNYKSRAEFNQRRFAAEMIAMRQRAKSDG